MAKQGELYERGTAVRKTVMGPTAMSAFNRAQQAYADMDKEQAP